MTRQHVQLGRVAHHHLACLDPDGTEPDPIEGRLLSLAQHGDGGAGAGRPLRRGPQHPPRSSVTRWPSSTMCSSGSTTARPARENSARLGERHPTKVHHGFRIDRPADGRWRTYRPDGTEILLHPPLRI
jgi:hypothetical protein